MNLRFCCFVIFTVDDARARVATLRNRILYQQWPLSLKRISNSWGCLVEKLSSVLCLELLVDDKKKSSYALIQTGTELILSKFC